MAENKLKIFGENLNIYPNQTDEDAGIVFSDDDWNKGELGSSSISKTGFIPGTPSSSIALNTALRQSSLAANLFGEILVGTRGFNITKDLGTDNLSNVYEDYVKPAITQLNKIQGLIAGDVIANRAKTALYAQNYDTENGNISLAFSQAENNIISLKNDLQQGNVVAGYAHNYTQGGELDNKLKELENIASQLANVKTKTIIIRCSRKTSSVYTVNYKFTIIGYKCLDFVAFEFGGLEIITLNAEVNNTPNRVELGKSWAPTTEKQQIIYAYDDTKQLKNSGITISIDSNGTIMSNYSESVVTGNMPLDSNIGTLVEDITIKCRNLFNIGYRTGE